MTAAEQGAAPCYCGKAKDAPSPGCVYHQARAKDAEQGAAVDGPSVAEVLADHMSILAVTSPNRAIWPLDEDYRQSLAQNLAVMLKPVIAAEVSRQVAAREAEAVDAALDKVERRLRALKRGGDPATHETVIQVALTIVREVRRPAPAEVAEVPGVEAVLADALHRYWFHEEPTVGDCLHPSECGPDDDDHREGAFLAAEVTKTLVAALAPVYALAEKWDGLASLTGHEQVSKRPRQELRAALAAIPAALTEALTQTAAPELGPESNDSHAWLGSDR
jgi:hypothetical protein